MQFESDGQILEVHKREAVLVDAEDLVRDAFKGPLVDHKDPMQVASTKTEANTLDTHADPFPSSADMAAILKRDNSQQNQQQQSMAKKSSTAVSADVKPLPRASWIREFIRVKIVSKKLDGGKYYLQKATVVDVCSVGVCTLRLDSGRLLEMVQEKYLETVLPSTGGPAIILTGMYRGRRGVLLEKQREEQRAIVQLEEDLEVVEVDMDDVAESTRPAMY